MVIHRNALQGAPAPVRPSGRPRPGGMHSCVPA
jgi:hypothetical protein